MYNVCEFFKSHYQPTVYPEAHVTEAIIYAVNRISIALRTGQVFLPYNLYKNILVSGPK